MCNQYCECRDKWKMLYYELVADIDRPDGRWGIHGNSSVDNDYFTALEYVTKRMKDIIDSVTE